MSERFVDNGNGTVTDTQTGLMWQKDPAPERVTWPEAQRFISYLNKIKFAGYEDWRLPNNEELSSLLLPEENKHRLYLDPIFGNQRCFWSATTRGHHTACYVDYFYGGIYRFPESYVNHSVRAVRGEMKKESQRLSQAA
ncbi:MAG: DUF1566 domain-containing protein [Deltaproteobacteria bacterium]|nr:DUF1566 domain-containing protein [Deltaproteobacteria bacterium]MBW2071539.1 DUF1566 domain-containing protein [Deltaproteobacteria bacterium]